MLEAVLRLRRLLRACAVPAPETALHPSSHGPSAPRAGNVFDSDATRYHTFAHQDPTHVSAVEFARHQAWRVRGRMDFLCEKAEFGQQSTEELAEVLSDAAATLLRSARLLRGEENDILEWIDHDKVQSKL